MKYCKLILEYDSQEDIPEITVKQYTDGEVMIYQKDHVIHLSKDQLTALKYAIKGKVI